MSHLRRSPLLAALVALAVLPVPTRAQDAQDGKPEAANKPGATPAAKLPGGANSITETYGSWTVNCHIENNSKACALSQSQGNQQSGQRVFAIELRPPQGGKTDGVILMPFGLVLSEGIKLKLDDTDFGKGARFSTCVPAGCLVPISLPTTATDALKKGTTLTVSAVSMTDNQAVTFSVSLDGFTAALNRIGTLAS